MSRSQEAVRARDIIRRRQRQGQDEAPVESGTLSSTPIERSATRRRDASSPQPEARHHSVSPPPALRNNQRMPVRITVSHQWRDGGRGEVTTDCFESTPPPQIYAVPTTDSFGDNESFVFRRTAMPTPTRNSHHSRSQAAPLHAAVWNHRPMTGAPLSSAPEYRHFRPTGKRSRPKNQQHRDFQYDEDAPSVTVQTVNVAQRSAFERRPPLSLDVWQSIANQGRKKNMATRMSPSYQHLKLLHFMQSMSVIRQVQFSPSTCLAADLLAGTWDQDNTGETGRVSSKKRDGRYRSIDPVRATVAALPSTPPVLNNRRIRLPRRSDVGFPDASPDEIRAKQLEISNEAEWEGASPRLVVLVTSDDLGKAVMDETDIDSSSVGSGGSSTVRTGLSQEHLLFNGGGLPSIPFAGRELIRAKSQNAQHFGQSGGWQPRLSRFLSSDPYSMLAPPLDAAYSPSKGWRPRPFHDRPAGMRYCLVSPLQGEFATDSIEPVVCSLALYSLPSHTGTKKHANLVSGKISEEFTFPASNLAGGKNVAAARRGDNDNGIDAAEFSAFINRRTNAIFSFDPLAVDGGPGSIYLVLQVFRAAQARENAGAQILSPYCFGLSPLFVTDPESFGAESMRWPNGETRHLTLQVFPSVPESQDAFVVRLSSIARENEIYSSFSSLAEDVKVDAMFSPETQRRKRGVVRLFKMPSKHSSQPSPMEHDANSASSHELAPREYSLFVSFLNADFLESLLATPSELGNDLHNNSNHLPQMLTDVSGDFAVVLDPTSQSLPPLNTSPVRRKRSTLTRLPISNEPAGYVRNSVFREVCYLPARPEKHYDFDSGLSYCSLLNLIYLYPRLLRLTGGNGGLEDNTKFSIRVQVLQTKLGLGDASTPESPVPSHVTLKAFHNPEPWIGPTLLNQIFTKSFGGHGSDISAGIQIRDEIKIRLPPVLDGSFSMRFELYGLSPGFDASMTLIAAALIPLSSSHSRDMGRVATIIPNGNHRVKLGDFQLQLETRLVSAIHVGDPSVATVLRDFPCTTMEADSDATREADSVEEATTRTDVFDAIFGSMLAEASPGSVVCHFDVLLQIHLSNIVNPNMPKNRQPRSPKFMIENMLSMFEVFGKVKDRFLDSRGRDRKGMLRAFIKKQLDLFDERFVSAGPDTLSVHPSNRNGTEAGSPVDVEIDPSISHDDSGVIEKDVTETYNEVAVRIKTKSERYGYQSPRNRNNPLAPFSRVAYGVSKIDRMKVEAEFYSQGGLLSPFFDDDETIATTPTLQTTIVDHLASETETGRQSIPRVPEVTASSHLVVRSEPVASHQHRPTRHHSGSGGPSLSNVLAKSTSPQSSSRVEKSGFGSSSDSPLIRTKTDEQGDDQVDSDGDESCSDLLDRRSGRPVSDASGPKAPVFTFSVYSKPDHEIPVASGDYLYESIILLWQNAWLEYVSMSLIEPPDSENEMQPQTVTFSIPLPRGRSPSPAPIFLYYEHMDVLLPLCLKSIMLRYAVEVLPSYPSSTKVLLDENHVLVLNHLVEMLARGLLGQALSGVGSSDGCEKALSGALISSETVLDFLVGLLAVFHPEHMEILLRTFFKTLRDGEIEHLHGAMDSRFEWTDASLQRVRSSRQLRLRAVEVLAVLPSFVSLNYPRRYAAELKRVTTKKATWLLQYCESDVDDDVSRRQDRHVNRKPSSGWLAELLVTEALSVCSLSCEAVVAEAIAHIEVSSSSASKNASVINPSLKKRPGAALKRSDLLMLQSLAVHSISCVYELLLRRHALDRRYQTESGRERIAGMYAGPILDKSLSSTRWLARMESTHKVRSLWLLCFVYVLQEAPTTVIRSYIESLCNPSVSDVARCFAEAARFSKLVTLVQEAKIHRFVRLLRLSSSTFQSFVDLPRHANFPSDVDKGLSPWLLQESFNTVVATTITVVEECTRLKTCTSLEEEKMLAGVLDLLLHLLTTPQSSVTYLRAVGGALQCLEAFGFELFIEVADSSLQHWLRVLISLMNSTSLAVRAIAVDFTLSLFGHSFDCNGNVDFLSIVFATVLAEVAAREIALCSVSGLISTPDDVSRCLWPLRRSIADMEGANPIDDDRVDPNLSPILSVFCRASQAILDGVLIELRLQGSNLSIVGSKIRQSDEFDTTFDADEESLYEAASFFEPESAPMQRLRWLLTLKSLHEAKGNWIEAAETLFMCAKAITDSISHLSYVWRPSRFDLWSDSRRSIWLDTVGEQIGHPDRGNLQVMEFAEEFLEPSKFLRTTWKATPTGKLLQPTVPVMSDLLGQIPKGLVKCYQMEEGMNELLRLRLSSLLRSTMQVLDRYDSRTSSRICANWTGATVWKRQLEDEACLRRVVAEISGDLVKQSEPLLAQKAPTSLLDNGNESLNSSKKSPLCHFVALRLSGKKPRRFQESTALPTFLEFESVCVCRLPRKLSESDAEASPALIATNVASRFASRLAAVLRSADDTTEVTIVTQPQESVSDDDNVTYLHAYAVDPMSLATSERKRLGSKTFFYRKDSGIQGANGADFSSTVVELKVAQEFPCPLSRQRVVLTSEMGFSGR